MIDIFSLFTFAGGLGLFLFGMNVLGEAIRRQAGGRMKRLLEKLGSNRLMGVLTGTAVTAVIQSSGATTVMILGFINSGIMTLENSISLIFGANIGTTATAWLLALNDISGDSFILRLLNPDSFVPVLAFIGAVLLVFFRSGRAKDVGTILLGFAVLMFGMDAMSGAMAPLSQSDTFRGMLEALDNPALGILAGFALAAVLQSSSASVGIVQAAAATGAITVANALPVIMGVNIGAGLIVLVASTGTNRDARRAAWVYMLHNILAAVLGLIPLLICEGIGLPRLYVPINAFDIALLHTLYKLAGTALQLPFVRQIIWLTRRIVRSQPTEQRFELLDENFLKTPPVAVARCVELTGEMAEDTRRSIREAISVIRSYDAALVRHVRELEERVDLYEDKIGGFLVKLAGEKLSLSDSREVTKLLHSLNDLERISDHARNIVHSGEELENKGLRISDGGKAELEVMLRALEEVVDLAIQCFLTEDTALALRIEPLEQVVDELRSTLRSRHIDRLKRGECGMTQSFVYTDILTDLERVSDHCTNIALSVLEMRRNEYAPHSYEAQLKVSDSHYNSLYGEYLRKYRVP
ncbi:MAG: Na/Pi cotransporter family protein [Oscillospiraceae bacterium]|nr:Na/Pi cotransporter family protein [Oscillospiraceae bacterium]